MGPDFFYSYVGRASETLQNVRGELFSYRAYTGVADCRIPLSDRLAEELVWTLSRDWFTRGDWRGYCYEYAVAGVSPLARMTASIFAEAGR